MDLQSIANLPLVGYSFLNGSFLGAEPLPGQGRADAEMFSALLRLPQYLLSLYLTVFYFYFSKMREETEMMLFINFFFFLLFISSDRALFPLFL